MIYIDNPFFQINITPPQSCNFPNSKTASDHDCKDWIPVGISVISFQETQEQILFGFRQCPSFFRLKTMRQILSHLSEMRLFDRLFSFNIVWNQFVLDTPVPLREVIRRLMVYQLHGNLTPGRISVGCSHCVRRLAS